MSRGALKKEDIHTGNTRDHPEPNFHQNNSGAIKTIVSSAEKDFVSSLKATTEAPPCSFEFFVRKDEGINLHVDLNTSPSGWINRFRNEVRTSENVYRKGSRGLWQELGFLRESAPQGKSSFSWKTISGQIDDHSGQTKSSLSSKLAKDDVAGLDQQNKGDSPLIYDSLTPCSMTVNVIDVVKENESAVSAELTVNVADNLKEYESIVSAEVSYGAPNNYISGAESCTKSKKIPVSDATDTPIIKSPFGSVGNSLSDPDTLQCQLPKPDNEISEDCVMLNGSCFVNPGMLCPGASLSGSIELQISEVASCHKDASPSLCKNDGFLALSDSKNNLDAERVGLVNSSKVNLDMDGKNLPSPTEEWEVGKIVTGRESSECSLFDDPHKKFGLEPNDQGYKMKLRKKRKQRDSEVQGSSDKPAAKILRSMKNIAVTVQPRRSMRLTSKNLELYP